MLSQLPVQDPRRTIHDLLKEYWGFSNFRPQQEEIINSVLEGKDTLALMPTGGGKSLCYQIPGMALSGLCLVISPLIALMKDQVENLRRKNITAYSIYSGMSRKEVMNTLEIAAHSNCKFLYVSPERLETTLFREFLPALQINLIAVDEAHCISQWGYDFRPPYLRIAALREEVTNVPVLALTASATPDVQEDICEKLSIAIPGSHSSNQSGAERQSLKEHGWFRNWNIFRQSFERPNLSYSVFNVGSRIKKIIEILQNVGGSGIVYCKSRKRTKEISELLKMNGISSDFYHAGLTQEERNRKQEEWINDRIRIISCTNAFGMGIDKPDVRVVIHADTPDCLENYYQEAGRAGRDGLRSYAVLLYNEADKRELEDSVSVRYPSPDQIREVYQAISNYLQIAAGTGQGEYFDFDIADFIRKFKLNTQVILYSLKALEQDEWLSFNEEVFLPPTARFTTSKEYLYQFEKDQPQLEPLIKTLLRAYEGIFEYPASISESMLAYQLKENKEEIKRKLGELYSYRIIEYRPQKQAPQLFFIRNRIRAEDLTIDMKAFNERKKRFIGRIRSMIHYINETADCRSKMIASYFGDHELKSCGICDNCLKQKSIVLTREEFDTIHNRIMDSLKLRPIHSRELLQELKGIQKEKSWKVINFLQTEDKIELDNTGRIRLK